MTDEANDTADSGPDEAPEFTLINGREAFREALLELIGNARMTLNIHSYDLSRDIYATPAVVEAIRSFALQHDRARVNILINQSKRTMAAGHRLVEFGRSLSSRIEFRQIPEDKRTQVEDCVLGDGRTMLLRQRPDDVEARIYNHPGTAHLRNQGFEALWPHANPARELQQLRM